MVHLDLNCDLGEGAGHDAELMPLITSANIACGAHAGDLATMRATVALALEHGVAIGAHPGFADRINFGRREISLSPSEVADLVLKQVRALQALGPVRHVKPHGALYNLAARDSQTARAVAEAVRTADRSLVLFALAGSKLVTEGKAAGLKVASEIFADRTYQSDGALTPRSQPNALITDESAAVAQVLDMVRRGRVKSVDGTDVAISADTLCLHGDGPHPVQFAMRLRRELAQAGIRVQAFAP